MAGIEFGNIGGGVTVGTMAGHDIIQASTLHEKDKAELQGLSNQLAQTVDAKKEGWQERVETIMKQMVSVGKDVAIKVAVGIMTKRLNG